jgi:hypothetical protein
MTPYEKTEEGQEERQRETDPEKKTGSVFKSKHFIFFVTYESAQ